LQEPYASKQVIFECIHEQATPLLGIIRSYALRFGLATEADVQWEWLRAHFNSN
jgi:hypothetical protein